MRNGTRFELRLPKELLNAVRQAATAGGFSSVNAYIRTVMQNELRHGETALDRTERTMGASIDRLSKEIRSLHTAQQAVFALTDSLARLFLTCVPEPPPEALDQAKRKAKLRYDRFLRSVAQNMTADARAALLELADRVR
jgi:hypothetical protein